MTRIISFAFLLLLFMGCRKEEDRRFSTDLAIDSRIVRLNALADTTRIIVYSDGDWQLEADTSSWVTVQTGSGNGKANALVAVTDNSLNLPRMAKLIVKANSKTDTIQLQQRGLVPTLIINDTTAQSIANGGTLKTPINTNIPLQKMDVSYRFDANGQNWVTDLQLTDGYLYFKVDTNKTASVRTAMLFLSYIDVMGVTVKDSIKINQSIGVDYKDAQPKDFFYIKNTLAAGVINDNIYVEGVVVSDKGHPNIAKNNNSTANKHNLDKTENSISVYVQSPDGKSGIYFKTKTAGDNIFNFNDKVKIWLKGTTLTKYTNPNRVIISNVVVTNVMQKDGQAASSLVPREKFMGELTDEDLYTYVKLKDVEISVPFGSFSNINEGYVARMDCFPTSIRDIQGNSMYMLTNLDVPYRRDGNAVPQGSGTITGIIVTETLERYGGNIGKYAIRHLKRADINLQQNRDNGFSRVLVEWSRYKNEFAATPTPASNPLTPDAGTGTITKSGSPAGDYTANGIGATNDYNGLIQEPTTVKGSISNGGFTSKNWWNNTTNTGEYWLISTSTAGIANPISLQVDGNVDIGGPRNFVVEWSDKNDGTAVWNTVSTFTFEDVANFSNTLLTQVAGYKNMNFQFPQAASGLQNLYIRLRVANKNVGTSTAATGGTLTATTSCRLVHVSIKYNK